MSSYRIRRTILGVIILLLAAIPLSRASGELPSLQEVVSPHPAAVPASLGALEVKGRAPKTGYARAQFGDGWATNDGCDTRERILIRDMKDVVTSDGCKVQSGTLNDPYTGKIINFTRGEATSAEVQIDHVVALSNAWQTGAQQLSYDQRVALANDPLELLAVDGPANQNKGDGDAATWLPPNKPFRCQYVSRQISVKAKYGLWVTSAERDAIASILPACKSP
jgi:hypothetical protein